MVEGARPAFLPETNAESLGPFLGMSPQTPQALKKPVPWIGSPLERLFLLFGWLRLFY